MNTPEKLNSEIELFVASVWIRSEAYLTYTRMSASKFGKLAANDPNLILDIRKGRRRLTFPMAQKIDRYFNTTCVAVTND